jgi:hypothetical protein
MQPEGCYYAREIRPRTPAEKGAPTSLSARIDDAYRKRKLERLIAVSTEDIAKALNSRPCPCNFFLKREKTLVVCKFCLKRDKTCKHICITVQG